MLLIRVLPGKRVAKIELTMLDFGMRDTAKWIPEDTKKICAYPVPSSTQR